MYVAKKFQSTYGYFFQPALLCRTTISFDKIFRVPPINRIKNFLKFPLSSREFPRSTASLIASGEATAKCGSEVGFTIKTFSTTFYSAAA